jgi:hypothetical protein
MKVAYIFAHPRCGTYKLGQMILPQLEVGVHWSAIWRKGSRVGVMPKDEGARNLPNAFPKMWLTG